MDDILDPQVLETLHRYGLQYEVLECDPELADTAAFCEHYGFSPEQAANTIVITTKKVEPVRYAVCVVLATTRLDVNKKVSEQMGAKRLSFADSEQVKQLTGMMIGGVTAVGISGLPMYVDKAVIGQEQVIMGGGNRSSKLLLDPRELVKLPDVTVVEGLAAPRA